jgi:hypothetical protein
MKNTVKLVGIIAFVAVIGFGMAACADGVDELNGTWVSEGGADAQEMTLKSGAMTLSEKGAQIMKGTFSVDKDKFTMTVTEIKGSVLLEAAGQFAQMFQTVDGNTWYKKAALKSAIQTALTPSGMWTQMESNINGMLDAAFISQKGTYKLNGNKLTLTVDGQPATLTKK